MTGNSNNEKQEEECRKQRLKLLSKRIKELGNKATQLLVFLSFALAAAVFLETSQMLAPCQKVAVKWAIRFWVIALFPILLNVLPVKEFMEHDSNWYNRVRWAKVSLLWMAVLLIACGATAFLCAVW